MGTVGTPHLTGVNILKPCINFLKRTGHCTHFNCQNNGKKQLRIRCYCPLQLNLGPTFWRITK